MNARNKKEYRMGWILYVGCGVQCRLRLSALRVKNYFYVAVGCIWELTIDDEGWLVAFEKKKKNNAYLPCRGSLFFGFVSAGSWCLHTYLPG